MRNLLSWLPTAWAWEPSRRGLGVPPKITDATPVPRRAVRSHGMRVAVLAGLATLLPLLAAAQPYELVSRQIMSFSAGGSYTLVGSFGQPAPLVQQGGQYSLTGGFFGVAVAIQQEGAPLLKIRRAGDNLVISWFPTVVSYQLEVKDSLDPDVPWTPAGLPITITDSENTVIIPVTPGDKFYRLHSP